LEKGDFAEQNFMGNSGKWENSRILGFMESSGRKQQDRDFFLESGFLPGIRICTLSVPEKDNLSVSSCVDNRYSRLSTLS
jgi:hypothetical protein